MIDHSHSGVLAFAVGISIAMMPVQGSGSPEADRQQWPPPEAAVCQRQPLRESGTTYYYCDCDRGAEAACVPGDDAYPGNTADRPRRTFENATSRFNSMNAGDTVALCRGGAWSTSGNGIYNTRCTAASPARLALSAWAAARRPWKSSCPSNWRNRWRPWAGI